MLVFYVFFFFFFFYMSRKIDIFNVFYEFLNSYFYEKYTVNEKFVASTGSGESTQAPQECMDLGGRCSYTGLIHGSTVVTSLGQPISVVVQVTFGMQAISPGMWSNTIDM